MRIEMFPEEWVELNREIAYHPTLMARLANQPDRDPYILLAEIAAHCGYILNDTYTEKQILTLCETFRKDLVSRRLIIIS
jgi:hypothetical protein